MFPAPLRSGMLILLPPSEGKTPPKAGEPLDLTELSFAGLAKTRKAVLAALVRFCRTDPTAAAVALGLGPTQAGHVRTNTQLRRAPAAPALDIYTGVLFEALDAGSLRHAERARLNRLVAISSALFGLVRPDDRIPAYRLSGDTTLPDLGPMSSVWRGQVSAQLELESGLILDLRSGTYVALGPVPSAVAGRSVVGRILHEHAGKRSIVSHHNKATKGRLVRSLTEASSLPGSIPDLLDALSSLGYAVELQPTRKTGVPAVVDVIVSEI